MSRFSKLVLSLVALLVIAAALAWWQRGPLSLWAMSRMVTQVTANADPIALMNDGAELVHRFRMIAEAALVRSLWRGARCLSSMPARVRRETSRACV